MSDLTSLITKPYVVEDDIHVVSKKRLRISKDGQAFDSFSFAPGWSSLYFTQLMKQLYFVSHTKNDDIVADVGCGKAELLERFWRNGRRCSYIGIDHSKKSLDRRSDMIDRSKNIVNAILIQDDFAKEICLADESVDVVVFSEIIEHFEKEDVIPVLHEIYRILKPSGRMFITTSRGHKKPLSGHLHEYEFNEFKEVLAAVPFTIGKEYGLFTSDYGCLTSSEKDVFDSLKSFYSVGLVRTILAVNHPEESRSWLIEAIKEP